MDVGYFVSESELAQYTQEERVRYESGDKKGKLRMYAKGTFIYRLAGREREKSASYYTPEVLTKCLVKYALKELLNMRDTDTLAISPGGRANFPCFLYWNPTRSMPPPKHPCRNSGLWN